MALALFGLNLLHILGLIAIAATLGLVLRRHCGLNACLWAAGYLVLSTGIGLAHPRLLTRAVAPLRDAAGIEYVGSFPSVVELHLILAQVTSVLTGVAALVIGLLLAGDAVRLLTRAGVETDNPALRLVTRMSAHPHVWGTCAVCLSLLSPAFLCGADLYFTAMAHGTLP